MNLCADGGYLVDGTRTLPTDPCDFHVPGLPIVGCTRLRCATCKALVRSVVGIGFRNELEKVDLAPIYDTADLVASPLMRPFAQVRLYLCRCSRHLEASQRPIADPDDDSFQAPAVTWRCEGHPLVTLPHDLDGLAVTSEEELARHLADALHGRTPPGARPEDRPAAIWAARVYRRLTGTPYQDGVARAAAAVMDDPDPAARARALQFFFTLELPIGAERALALLEGDRRLFAGVPDEATQVRLDKTLEETLWRVVTPLVRAPGRARELARAEALAPGKGSAALYAALAAGDPEWVAAHGEEVIRATPAQGKTLVDHIRARFPRSVPTKPVVDRLTAFLKTSSAAASKG